MAAGLAIGSTAGIGARGAIVVMARDREEYGGQGELGGGVAELLLLELLCEWESGKRW